MSTGCVAGVGPVANAQRERLTPWCAVSLCAIVSACGSQFSADNSDLGGATDSGGSATVSNVPTPCSGDTDCGSSGVCDTTSGRCVECTSSVTCGSMKTCVEHRCRSGCRSDKECTPLGMLCDQASQYCVECIDDSQCRTGQHCSLGLCTTAVCIGNAASCGGVNDASCVTTANGAPCSASTDPDASAADGNLGHEASSDGPSTTLVYTNALLISHFEAGRTDLDGAYFSQAGGAGTISPLVGNVEYADVFLTAGGYQGRAIRVTGSAPADGTSYASLGVMMLRSGPAYNASPYDGIAFYARATSGAQVFVGAMQPNNEPSKGSCVPDVTCYNRPGMALQITSTWQRYVMPFAQLKSAVQGGTTVPLTPATINGWVFAFQGSFDFYLDEMYFVKLSGL